jgi:hypothetical protein
MVAVHLKAMHELPEAQLAVYVNGETHAPAVAAGIAVAVIAGLPKPSQHRALSCVASLSDVVEQDSPGMALV